MKKLWKPFSLCVNIQCVQVPNFNLQINILCVTAGEGGSSGSDEENSEDDSDTSGSRCQHCFNTSKSLFAFTFFYRINGGIKQNRTPFQPHLHRD